MLSGVGTLDDIYFLLTAIAAVASNKASRNEIRHICQSFRPEERKFYSAGNIKNCTLFETAKRALLGTIGFKEIFRVSDLIKLPKGRSCVAQHEYQSRLVQIQAIYST